MKHLSFLFLLAALLAPLPSMAAEESLADRLQGHILLQVEEHGEAYFVHDDGKRYYMRDGNDAYTLMREFSLGISNTDLDQVPAVESVDEYVDLPSVCDSSPLANRLRGKILLQVEEHGEAHYVDPTTCVRVYMDTGATAYEIMRYRGLGITNADLERIPLGVFGTDHLLAPELAAWCDEFSISREGDMETITCSAPEGDMVVEIDLANGSADTSLSVAIAEEDYLFPDVADETGETLLNMLPILTNFACDIPTAYMTGNLNEFLDFGEEYWISEYEDVRDLTMTLTITDTEGTPLAGCTITEPSYSSIEFMNYSGITQEEALKGIMFGYGTSGEDSIEAFFEYIFIESFQLTEEEMLEIDDELLDELVEGFTSLFTDFF